MLTDHQWEITALIAEGLTNQAIADRLGVPRLLVSQDIAAIMWQLGLASRHEIAAWAIERGLPPALPSSGGRVVATADAEVFAMPWRSTASRCTTRHSSSRAMAPQVVSGLRSVGAVSRS